MAKIHWNIQGFHSKHDDMLVRCDEITVILVLLLHKNFIALLISLYTFGVSLVIRPGRTLLDQLLIILVGCFNAHNPYWGHSNPNPKGACFENINDQYNLHCFMNKNAVTHLHL